MSYDAYSHFEARLRPGTPARQVEKAVEPFFVYFLGNSRIKFHLNKELGDHTGISYHPGTGEFALKVNSEIGMSFREDVFLPVINEIGELLVEPIEVQFKDGSEGTDDDTFTYTVGPAHLLPEFNARQSARRIGPELRHIVPPPGSIGLSIPDIVASQGASISFGPKQAVRARVIMDLEGLDLTQQQRDEAAALFVCLGRTLAARDDQFYIDLVHEGDDRERDAQAEHPGHGG